MGWRISPRDWEIISTSARLGGVLGQSAGLPDFSVLGEAERLSARPDAESVMRFGPARGKAISALGDYLADARPSVAASASRLGRSGENRRGMARIDFVRPGPVG